MRFAPNDQFYNDAIKDSKKRACTVKIGRVMFIEVK